eukprot:TRINITY_DN44866_c0_g1_i1.p1 TRINITY_DN44866_c0_g1~~TRINITY_DN44866_c0_g1_i1.p1  ORF type:complete len:232 (+),score=31.90 TRINITY_DN44866_c0_g1_i1:76-771(+)
MAAWYPTPMPVVQAGRPAWDTCWDFAAIGRQGDGFEAYQMQVPHMMVPNAPWAGLGMQPTPAAAPPPWWPTASPYAMTPYWPAIIPGMPAPLSIVGDGGSVAFGTGVRADVPAGASVGVSLPKALEKRLGKDGEVTVPTPPPPAPPPDKEFEGSLKSLSAKNGYGFIACDEIHKLYKRDVYFPRELVSEGVKVLDRIRFKITLSAKGHPQVSWAEVAALEVPVETCEESKP